MFCNKGVFSAVLLTLMIVQPGVSLAATEEQSPAKPGADMAASAKVEPVVHNHYPNWPQRQQAQVRSVIVPPPPPGPYMSTALSNSSVSGGSLTRPYNMRPSMSQGARPASQHKHPSKPMDMFSPDRPWPKDLRSQGNAPATKWMPEHGYHYISPPRGNVARPSANSGRANSGSANSRSMNRGRYPATGAQPYPGDRSNSRAYNRPYSQSGNRGAPQYPAPVYPGNGR